MKTRCALQEHPSENDDVEVSFFSYAELTFHDCFFCRNDNSKFIKELHTINLSQILTALRKKDLFSGTYLFFYHHLFSSPAICPLSKFRLSPRHEATSCDLPFITPKRFVDYKSFIGQLAL